MKSLKQLYKIGVGPSSSHTMGPVKIAERYLSENDGCDNYVVTLYGSLALTGKGHGTDTAITQAFGERRVSIVFDTNTKCVHPNTMLLCGYVKNKEVNRM